eukprot:scaffold250488_cov14-Tisochrysis_lutea.AAC.1
MLIAAPTSPPSVHASNLFPDDGNRCQPRYRPSKNADSAHNCDHTNNDASSECILLLIDTSIDANSERQALYKSVPCSCEET